MDETLARLRREDPEIDAYFRLSRMIKQENIEGIEAFHREHPNLEEFWNFHFMPPFMAIRNLLRN
jgi:hypothetical protein